MMEPHTTYFILLPLIIITTTSYLNVMECGRLLTHPELHMTLEQRIARNGYPIETHRVETEDGYILSLYRIPHGHHQQPSETIRGKNRSALLILNGMGGSPHNFIVLGKGRGAAYYFADKGLDVWLFAGRGIAGSFKEKHIKYDWDRDDEYWSYSMHEIGVYDLTASIDFVLRHTGQEKVSLIGHSAGGWEFFCMLSERPEYNAKIKVAINYGCTPIVKHMDYPVIQLGVETIEIFKAMYKYLHLVEFLPLYEYTMPFLKKLCADSDFQKFFVAFFWLIGSHRSVIDSPDDVILMINDVPRVAVMQFFHFADNVRNGVFSQYDHGPHKNMKIYGQKHPPPYNMSAVTAPLAFFVAGNDGYVVKKDVIDSVKVLPNTILIYDIPFPRFTHTDFVFGKNATELVYEPTYRLINDFDKGIVWPPIKL